MKLFSFLDRKKQFAILALILVLGAVEFATSFFSDSSPGVNSSSAQVVAVVQTVKTDVRQKPVEESTWYRAEPKAEVVRGDAIYSGRESHSLVRMNSGGLLELGEETLVIFDDVDGVTIPDVTRGQVKLKINGPIKIAISGEMTEFVGAQSELLLNASDRAGQVRVVKGEASISTHGVKKTLVTGESLELAAPKARPKITAPTEAAVSESVSKRRKLASIEAVPVVRAPDVEAPAPIVVSQDEATEIPSPVATEVVAPSEPVAEPVAMVAPEPAPPVVVKEALSAKDRDLKIQRVMLVQEVYKRQGARSLVPRVGLKTLKVPVALEWNGAAPDDNLKVQVSKDADFSNPWYQQETSGRNLVVSEWKPGKNYWRVSRDGQTWSETASVTVKPTVSVSQAPTVAAFKNRIPASTDVKLRFADSGLAKPRGWVLQGSQSLEFLPKKTKTVFVTGERVDIPLKRAGKYYFRVRSVGTHGEISTYSPSISVEATKPVAVPVPVRVAKQPEIKKTASKKRQVAAVEEKLEEPAPETLASTSKSKVPKTESSDKDLTRHWKLGIEGGELARFSSEQVDAKTDPASVHVARLRLGYADSKNSASLAYMTKFGSSNSEGDAQTNRQFELRYTRWWQTSWAPLRVGWAGGFDSYRNGQGTARYSKGYDYLKTGLDVDIAFANRWKTGGNAYVGAWTDSNRVYEFGGFVSYDLTKELAFGVGYRLSLFDITSQAASPVQLPYREASGEAYSSLQFSF